MIGFDQLRGGLKGMANTLKGDIFRTLAIRALPNARDLAAPAICSRYVNRLFAVICRLIHRILRFDSQ